MPAISAQSLSEIDGVEAICITIDESKYQENTSQTIPLFKTFSQHRFINRILRFAWRKLFYKREIKKWIDWADVLHYNWTTALPNGEDLAYARKQHKPIFIEWLGSEIRNPDYLKTINPYYKFAFEHGYEYAGFESATLSEGNQQLFAKYGGIPLVCPEMSLYLNKGLFNKWFLLMQRINTSKIQPVYPRIDQKKPIIVHSPTALIAKGTNHILPVIEKLKEKYDFDFRLIHNVSRSEALEMIAQCDIFIDQIIGGSYGMAAMEAMSYGKPTLCWVLPEVMQAGLPDSCPIVNTNPDNLELQLIQLLEQPELRNEIGVKSREYVDQYHDAKRLGTQLLSIYDAVLKHQPSTQI